MKAVYIEKQGDPQVLTYGDLPDPKIGPDEVLVRVRACALNHLDVFTRAGQRGTRREFARPLVLGSDIAGEVVQVGSQASAVKAGERVMLFPAMSCGRCPYCLSGQENFCPAYSSLGTSRDGGYAEYVSVPAINAHAIPSFMSYEEAAAIPLVFLTAWHMLIKRAQLRPGEVVLVQAVGSGVGSAALQIAKLLGARTIVTASTQEKLARAKELGADEVINYSTEDFAQRVKEMTNGQGVDVVFDHIGASVWEKSFASLKQGGRFVNCGVTAGYKVELHMGQMFTRQLTLMGSRMGSRGDMVEFMTPVNQGRLRGVVHRVFDLKDAAQAHIAMENRDVFGKLVLRVP